MNLKHTLQYTLSSLLLICGVAVVASADPPGRVGRLNYIDGSVSFRPASENDWGSATINYPLTTGDELWTDNGSRAELHIGATAIQLSEHTDFGVTELTDSSAELRIAQGTVEIDLRDLPTYDTFQVDTPGGAVSLVRNGIYRIDVTGDQGSTSVTVRDGEAAVTGASNVSVYSGQSAYLDGGHDIRAAIPVDSWDGWCDARDQGMDRDVPGPNLSTEETGYEDLGAYGTWYQSPDYGQVWTPRYVSSNWAPYRDGHWAWVNPWGWTWIDEEPWGFAPFHYGRWAYESNRWCWVPGTYIERPVYAPALVAFIGGNGLGFDLSFGGGGIGWFPLGPREVYVPGYAVSRAYIRNVNITNVNITNIYNVTNTRVNYMNQRIPGAVTAVSRNDFLLAHSVARSAVVVPAFRAAVAPVTGTAVSVAPRRESILGAGNRAVSRPSPVIADRSFAKGTQQYHEMTQATPQRNNVQVNRPVDTRNSVLASQPGRTATYPGSSGRTGYAQSYSSPVNASASAQAGGYRMPYDNRVATPPARSGYALSYPPRVYGSANSQTSGLRIPSANRMATPPARAGYAQNYDRTANLNRQTTGPWTASGNRISTPPPMPQGSSWTRQVSGVNAPVSRPMTNVRSVPVPPRAPMAYPAPRQTAIYRTAPVRPAPAAAPAPRVVHNAPPARNPAPRPSSNRRP